jgi:hypothetical protein
MDDSIKKNSKRIEIVTEWSKESTQSVLVMGFKMFSKIMNYEDEKNEENKNDFHTMQKEIIKTQFICVDEGNL